MHLMLSCCRMTLLGCCTSLASETDTEGLDFEISSCMQINLLDEEVLEAAVTVQKLQRRRGNLKALQHKLQVSGLASHFSPHPDAQYHHKFVTHSHN